MKPHTYEHSWYHFDGLDESGVKWYSCRCVFCMHVDRIGVPSSVSSGLAFTHPKLCPHCNKRSKHYCKTRKDG